jgi:hypothetical protein
VFKDSKTGNNKIFFLVITSDWGIIVQSNFNSIQTGVLSFLFIRYFIVILTHVNVVILPIKNRINELSWLWLYYQRTKSARLFPLFN